MEQRSIFSFYVRSFVQDAGLVVVLLAIATLAVGYAWWRLRPPNQHPAHGHGLPPRLLGVAAMLCALSTALLAAVSLEGSALWLAKPLVLWGVSTEASGATADSHATTDPCTPLPRTMVVLSGGIESSTMPSISTLLRVESAAALLKNEGTAGHHFDHIALSGGIGVPELGVSESAVMGRYFDLLVPNQNTITSRPEGGDASNTGGQNLQPLTQPQVLLEEASRTTHENALFTRSMLAAKGLPLHAVLVTSAEHMFRSRLTFEAQGFQVCPRPATPRRYRAQRLFTFRQAGYSSSIIHEWLGLFGYAISGKFS